MSDEQQVKFPPRLELSVGTIIRIVAGLVAIASALVSVTSFVVKTSFPSDLAREAMQQSLDNKSRIDNMQQNLGNASIPERLTKLETEQVQEQGSRQQIQNSLDKITDILLKRNNQR